MRHQRDKPRTGFERICQWCGAVIRKCTGSGHYQLWPGGLNTAAPPCGWIASLMASGVHASYPLAAALIQREGAGNDSRHRWKCRFWFTSDGMS